MTSLLDTWVNWADEHRLMNVGLAVGVGLLVGIFMGA